MRPIQSSPAERAAAILEELIAVLRRTPSVRVIAATPAYSQLDPRLN
jgi:hypothetical protein